MIVGFSRHGTGKGSGPVGYLTDAERLGREHAPPEVLRGNAEQTKNLIDSLAFKHKYTSGVLSFAPNEEITPEMELAVMDRFEQVAFAGLERDQYNILWVKHTHAGHHELNFVVPRVELISGKSLNIRPPGEKTKQHYDDFRSEINARYALADPTDPSRARNVSTPDHELKIASEALRRGEKAPENIRELIDGVLTQRVTEGLITNREDVLTQVKDLGFNITRTGKDYITVQEPESGQRWRMKGPLYAREFEPSRTLEATETARERDYSKPDERTVQRYAKRVEQHISARAEYHKSRYPISEKRHSLEHIQEQNIVASRDRVQSLSGYLRRELGNDSLSVEQDASATDQCKHTGEQGREDEVQHLYRQQREGPSLYRNAQQSPSSLHEQRQTQPSLDDSERVLNNDDRIRKPLTERLQDIGESVQQTARSLKNSAEQFTKNVREYFTRKQSLATASTELERTGTVLERQVTTVDRVVQQEQTLVKQQERQLTREHGGPELSL